MFGLSGSTSKSRSTGRSQATSSSFGRSDSVQGATAGSVSGGASVSQAASRDRIAFEDVFSRLFSSAEGSAAGLDPSLLTDASNQLFAGGTEFLEGIGGDAGTAFLTERLADRDTLEAEQIDQLQTDIGKLFQEELLPGITSEAVAGGQLGGGRQGVAQTGATEAAAEAFTRGSLDIRQQNQAQLDELAAGVASRNIQGAQVGLAGGDSLAALAELGFGADFRSIQMLAEVFGGPQTLTESLSSGIAEDFARSFSDSFGRSRSREGAESQSTSFTESRGSSKSAGIGF